MTEQLTASLLTIEIQASGIPLSANLFGLDDITFRIYYSEAMPLLWYYATDLLKELEKDLAEITPKLNQQTSKSPRIILSKTIKLNQKIGAKT